MPWPLAQWLNHFTQHFMFPVSSDDKESGLNSLALISADVKLASEAIEAKLTRLAAPLISDASLSPEARLAAAGAVNNLSQAGPEICHEMLKQVQRETRRIL